MKSFIVALILFSLFLGGAMLNSFYIVHTSNEIISYADGIRASLYAPSDIDLYWQKHRGFLALSVSESKIERMDELIISLFAADAEQNSYETERICRLIASLSKDISANERISLQGIL